MRIKISVASSRVIFTFLFSSSFVISSNSYLAVGEEPNWEFDENVRVTFTFSRFN